MSTYRAMFLLTAAFLGAASATAVSIAADSKEVVSDHFRLVFIAGLEGSGHHYFMTADKHMFRNNPNLPRIKRDDHLGHAPYFLPAFMGGKATNYAEAENKARQEMRHLADTVATMPYPGAMYIEQEAWSYPTFTGQYKVMQYLDMQRMAEIAASEGVDMRVLYLQRSAWDTIIANTVHRKFQQ